MFKLNFSRQLLTILSAALLVLASACSSDGEERPEYLETKMLKNLEVPPKLSVPDTSGALRLPEPSAKAQKAFADGNKTSKVIAPSFKGMSLKNDGQLYWLEIDYPLEKLWSMLPGFLAAEGIEVERVEKLMGFVDTQWLNEYQITYNNEGKGSSWFKGFVPDYKDKFRLRVEAADNKAKSRLYVAHRGMQIVVTNDVSEWAQRETEPFLEREIMYRFMLFAGASKHSASNLLAGYRSYQSRVVESSNVTEVIVQGDKDNVWLRLRTAIDRLGVDTINADKKNRKLKVLVGNLNTVETGSEQSSGWFSGLFGGGDIDVGDDEEYETAEYKKPEVKADEKITLNVQQQVAVNSSTIKLSFEDGSKVEDGLALDFRNALLQQLK